MYMGEADWTLIGRVKENPRMHIPIIGNGDITTPERALECFERYGVDGIMIGRASFGCPWIFWEVKEYIRSTSQQVNESTSQRVEKPFTPYLSPYTTRCCWRADYSPNPGQGDSRGLHHLLPASDRHFVDSLVADGFVEDSQSPQTEMPEAMAAADGTWRNVVFRIRFRACLEQIRGARHKQPHRHYDHLLCRSAVTFHGRSVQKQEKFTFLSKKVANYFGGSKKALTFAANFKQKPMKSYLCNKFWWWCPMMN
jgi:hypothetical protein